MVFVFLGIAAIYYLGDIASVRREEVVDAATQ
jgi:hypothetical protein